MSKQLVIWQDPLVRLIKRGLPLKSIYFISFLLIWSEFNDIKGENYAGKKYKWFYFAIWDRKWAMTLT